MPTLSEATSKLSLSKELTEYQPSFRERVLQWLQENPEACKNTTFKQLAKESVIAGMTTKQIQDTITALSHNQLIYYKAQSKSFKAKKNIYINYLHKNLPKSILENAPDKAVEEAKKTIAGVEIKREAKKLLEQELSKDTEIIEASTTRSEQKPTVEIPLEINEKNREGLSLNLNINISFK